LQVIRPVTEAGKVAPRQMDGFTRLIEKRYFTVDRFDLEKMEERRVAMAGPGCLVGLKGKVAIITPGDEVELEPGKAVVVPEGLGEVIVEAERESALLRCVAP
jgi:mannose-6-phosphate isomerase